MNETVRWGILGCGDVAEKKSGPALYQTPGSELVAVMRRDAAQAEAFAKRHGAARWYTDAQALVADPEVNAVYIASPHDLHPAHVALAARAGKQILCEKPVGTSAAEAQGCVESAAAHGVSLTVAYYRRFWPVVQRMKRMMDEGALGRVVQVRMLLTDCGALDADRAWRTSRAKAGGGVLADSGSHWIDLARYMFGELTEVKALYDMAPDLDIEDSLVAQMRAASGALVSFNITQRSAIHAHEFDIFGTEGRLQVPSLPDGTIVLTRPDRAPETILCPRRGVMHTHLVEALVPALLNGEPSPLPGEEAVGAWRVMEAAYRSCAEDARVRV